MSQTHQYLRDGVIACGGCNCAFASAMKSVDINSAQTETVLYGSDDIVPKLRADAAVANSMFDCALTGGSTGNISEYASDQDDVQALVMKFNEEWDT